MTLSKKLAISLFLNLLLVIAITWVYIVNSSKEPKDPKTPFSLALAADTFTSVGTTEILEARKLRAARIYIISNLLDESYANLDPILKALIEQTLHQNSSREEVSDLLFKQFEEVCEISIDVDPDGTQRLYFLKEGKVSENKVQLLIWGAKDGLFVASNNKDQVRLQIQKFVEASVDSIMDQKDTQVIQD